MTEFLLSIPIIGWILKPLIEKEEAGLEVKKEEPFNLKEKVEFYKENNMYGFGEGTKEDILKVEISKGSLDINKIKEYQGTEIRKFEFRPQNFKQFIGQKDAKERAKTIIKKVKRNIRAHFILSAIKGHGKTTFVELLAKELDAHLIERVGKQVDEHNLVDIINEINASEKENVIFFLDEMDSMDWKVIKILNPIIEQFKIAGKKIKPFIFAGATINKHILVKNNPDTLDRIPCHLKFERYNSLEIGQIITQYHKKLYSQEVVPQEVIKSISENCKFNPRTSIALLEEYIVEKDINKVLKNCKIINSGLTKTDIDILKVLNKTTRAIGANALAMKVGLSEKEYVREYEPFLCEYNYLNRIPSRVITDKGRKLLEKLRLK